MRKRSVEADARLPQCLRISNSSRLSESLLPPSKSRRIVPRKPTELPSSTRSPQDLKPEKARRGRSHPARDRSTRARERAPRFHGAEVNRPSSPSVPAAVVLRAHVGTIKHVRDTRSTTWPASPRPYMPVEHEGPDRKTQKCCWRVARPRSHLYCRTRASYSAVKASRGSQGARKSYPSLPNVSSARLKPSMRSVSFVLTNLSPSSTSFSHSTLNPLLPSCPPSATLLPSILGSTIFPERGAT